MNDTRHRIRMLEDTLDTRRPFSTAQALAYGITKDRLRSHEFEQILRGYYVDARAARDPFARIRAAVGLHPPGAFASHLSAARVYRLPVPATAEEHVTVGRDCDKRRRAGVRSHSTQQPSDLVLRHGIPVASPCATFVSLACMLDLVIVGDAMVKRGLATIPELQAAATASSGKGAVSARKAASYVRTGVDSPQETRVRMLIVIAGLPEPVVNHILRDQAGEWIARLDLSYPQYGVIVEYDGRQHAEDARQWQRDIERREMLENAGWTLVIVTAKGIYQEPEVTLDRIDRALRSRGCRLRGRSPAWRSFFPAS